MASRQGRPVMNRHQQREAEAAHWRWEAAQEAKRADRRRAREQQHQQRKDGQ